MKDVDAPPVVLAGRYELQREIGRGGMGAVFLARDLKHDSHVAVKMLGPGFGTTDAVDRFLGEIRTTAQLNHAHILTIHDSGEADGELFYVMPHIEGASLRDRLDRESRLSITEALRIACQIARALAYAHSHGVIHRDVKPENILLDSQGHPYLMDFGLARALSSITVGRRTAHGMTVGSPLYMSPEQAAGEDVDGRSDIYSLGCVLFEMLVGAPPFAAPNVQALLRKHLTEPAPSVRSRRADVPESLDRLLRTALAKDPQQRQQTAEALGREVEAVLDATARRRTSEPQPRVWLRPVAIAAGVILAVSLLVLAVAGDRTLLSRLIGEPPDSTRWLVLPLQWADGSEPSPDGAEDRQLYAAFDRWADLEVIDRITVTEEVENRGGIDAFTASIGFDLARNLGAGRLVQGLATRIGNSIQIDLTVSDAAGERRPLRQLTMRVPAGGESQPHYALAADSLVFGRISWSDGPEWDIGTRSAAARLAYGGAHDAFDEWDVERADSLLRVALERDPSFARAHLWLAQLASWRGRAQEAWLPSARFASAREPDLAARERLLAAGLVAFGEGRYPDACTTYRRLVEQDDGDFAGWFGLGECSTGDERVVRDPRSPSGWRFRASYHEGVEAYVRAFRLAPGSYRVMRDDAFHRVRDDILFTRKTRRREGASDTQDFSARPQWVGDSLALTPFPWRRGGPHPDPVLPGTERALFEHRRLFGSVARWWSSAHPQDAHALHAVALSLEMVGDAAALDTLQRARRFAHSRTDQLELAIQEVWLRVKLSPIRDTDLATARALADSILDSPEANDVLSAQRLAALCVLVGKPTLGASYARRIASGGGRVEFPSSASRPAAALLVFAAAGGPADSIAALEAETESAIRNGVLTEDQTAARRLLLELSSILAFPEHRFNALNDADVFQSLVSRAQAALIRADTSGALAILEPYRELPGGTLDIASSAAVVAALAGDTATAVATLDTALATIRHLQPGMIENHAYAGALVRAMSVRAELAAAAGDRETARRWSRAVVALWARGEPAIQHRVQRMRQLQ